MPGGSVRSHFVGIESAAHVFLGQILGALQQISVIREKDGAFTEARRDAVKAVAQ